MALPLGRGALAAGVLTAVAATTAGATAVGPSQSFHGVVNKGGQTPTVAVVCAGPAAGDRRGPPAGNQTLAVTVSPALSGPGFTGSAANRIVALFVDDKSAPVTFRAYDHPKPIPTSLRLPCSGTGTVRFAPRPVGSGAHADRVVVQYVNIAD
jgi:hypothetical protein